MSHHFTRGLRRGAGLAALAGVLGLAAIGLTQCRQVENNVTGVDMGAVATIDAKAKCVQTCQDKYLADLKVEAARHDAAIKKCGKDKNCTKAEDAKNVENKKKIEAAMQDCKKKCYNEGSGKGGR